MQVELSRFTASGLCEESKPYLLYDSHDIMGDVSDSRVLLRLSDGEITKEFIGGKEVTRQVLSGELAVISGETILRLLKVKLTKGHFMIMKCQQVSIISPVKLETSPIKEKTPVQLAKIETGPIRYFPLNTLDVYRHGWIICARVVFKSDLVSHDNGKWKGKIFNAILQDQWDDTILAKAIGDGAEENYEKLQVNSVVTMSNAAIGWIDKRFSAPVTLPSQITLEPYTKIETVQDDETIGQRKPNFVPLNQIETKIIDGYADIVAIINSIGEVQEGTRRNGSTYEKRVIRLYDDTKTYRNMTVFDAQANMDINRGDVITILNCEVSTYQQNVQLRLSKFYSEIRINADFDRVQELKEYVQNYPQSDQPRLETIYGAIPSDILAVYNRHIVNEPQARSYNLRLTLTGVHTDMKYYYNSCNNPDKNCMKKVIEENGMYKCFGCGYSSEVCNGRYTLKTTFDGIDGVFKTTMFDDQAVKLLGVRALEFADLSTEAQGEIMSQIKNRAYDVQLGASMRKTGNRWSQNFTVKFCKPLDGSSVEERKKLTSRLKELQDFVF